MFGKITMMGFAALACFAGSAFAEAYNWGNVRFDGGGFVSAVLLSEQVEGLVYARTDVGGVYRWDAAASRWVPLMDWVSQNDVGLYGTEAFALDPTDPAKIYVLGGTGYFSDGRTAVLRSGDFGATWDTSYVEMLAHGNGMGRQTGEKLAVDPNKPSVVLCGSRTRGLYKSTDSGKTWTSLFEVATSSVTGSSLNGVNGISFVMFDKDGGTLEDGSSKVIYLGISESKDNFRVSKDGGKTWSVVAGAPEGLMPHRAKIVDGDMFITFADGPGPYNIAKGGVYKYNMASGAWTDITPSDDGEKNTSPYGGVAIDPKDKNHIVVSTLGVYTGRYYYEDKKENYGDRIYVTKDGGKTWTYGQHPDSSVPNVDPQDNKWIHGNAIHWAGSVEFDPFNSKKVWVTSGNGVFQTDDINADVPVWKFQSRGIEETVPLDVVSIPEGPLVTAIGDYDGASYYNINESYDRPNPIVGTTQSMGYAPLSGTLVRTGVVTVYGQYESINYKVMYRSDDYGATWDSLKTSLMGEKGQVSLSADGKVILHRPENSGDVYRSDDNGASWTKVAGLDGQSNGARIVPDPVNADVFYLVDAQGNLKMSSDKGAKFANYGTSLLDYSQELYYNGGGLIRTVPGREGHIWVPLDQAQVWLEKGYSENGLAYTEDAGKTWIRCSGVTSAVAVGIGKAKDGADYETIYIWGVAGGASNPMGIYRSTDKGETWTRVNDDAHQFGGPGNGNFVQGDMNTFGVVYMSTVGRGLVVGAPEGVEITTKVAELAKRGALESSLLEKNRSLHVNVTGAQKVVLLNAVGKVVVSAFASANTVVDLKKIPAGAYLARVLDANGMELAKKIVRLK